MGAREHLASGPNASLVVDSHQRELRHAVLQTLAYSDIFDYPLTPPEIHRYLIGQSASLDDIYPILEPQLPDRVPFVQRDGFVALPGRETAIATRRERAQRAAKLWPRALRYGRAIASLPNVRMVAITGELAMDNVGPHSDIDYFIVTAPGAVWTCRLLTVGMVKVVAPFGDIVCPNYLIADTNLQITERNLYTAHEIVQMVPISGLDTYQRLRDENRWVEQYLPNAAGPPRQIMVKRQGAPLRKLTERTLRTRPGQRLEHWEMRRKIRKLREDGNDHPETSFGPDCCKGHVDGHAARILNAYEHRLRAIEVPPE